MLPTRGFLGAQDKEQSLDWCKNVFGWILGLGLRQETAPNQHPNGRLLGSRVLEYTTDSTDSIGRGTGNQLFNALAATPINSSTGNQMGST